MSDIQISPTGITAQATSLANRPCIWISDQIGYVFFYRSDDALRGSLWYAKTLDGGQTWTSLIDTASAFGIAFDGTYLYVSVLSSPAQVVKIDPVTMKPVAVWKGTSGQNNGYALTYDGTFLYVGLGTTPAQVVKINTLTMATVAAWTGGAGVDICVSITTFGGYVYAGLLISPAKVVKIDVSTMTTSATWTGAAGENNCYGLANDGTYVYGGLSISPSQVKKIDVSTMTTSATWTGAAGDDALRALIYDGTFLYAGLQTSPATIKKINPSTMTTSATWTGGGTQNNCTVLLSANSKIYVGVGTSPAQVSEINPGTMTTTLTWTGAAGENIPRSLGWDGTRLYVGLQLTPARVIKVNPATMTTVTSYIVTTKVNTEAAAANAAYGFSCWYDKWTPGDAGTKIHISWMDVSGGTSAAIVKYRDLDTSNDTLGSQITVASGLSISVAASSVSGITKARGGYLYILRRNDGSNTFYRSITSGATWSGRTAPTVTNPTAQPCLTPGNEADNQDIYGVWAEGASLKLQFYDDSANTWTTTTIVALGETLSADIWAASIRKSDNHTIVVARVVNGANKDLKAYDVSAGTTFTTLIDVYTNEANHGNSGVGILITATGTIYVDYAGIVGTTNAVAYRKSTDAGVTWSAAVRLDTAAAASTVVELALNQPPAPAGARLYGMWQETLVKGNYGTSIPLVTAALAGSIVPLSPVFLG